MTKVSVITVVYNDFFHIEETIKSVLSQNFENLEYIIIDGGSNDGTKEIIDSYKSGVGQTISEPDLGIYDAMNKGIKLATGDWLIFLNSGDIFFDQYTLTKVDEFLSQTNASIVYGDVIARSLDLLFDFTLFAGEKEGLTRQMIMNHQGCFIRRSLHSQNLYSLKYKIASDYRFFLMCLLNGYGFLKVSLKIAVISTDGVSDANRSKTFKEVLSIKNELNPNPGNYLYFGKQVIYYKMIRTLKLILPKDWFFKLYKRKYNS